MDWRVFFTTFGLIFLAELGDKTQLVAIAMAVKSRSPLAVFLGAVLALAMATLIGVLFGEALTRVVPEAYMRKAAGILFLAVGLLILSGRL